MPKPLITTSQPKFSPSIQQRLLRASVGALFGGVALCAGCNAYDPGPFDPASLQHLERQRSAENVTGDMRAIPTTLQSPYLQSNQRDNATSRPLPTTRQVLEVDQLPEVATVRFSLHDLLKLNALYGLNVRIASYQQAIDADRITEAYARFDLAFYTNVSYQDLSVVQPTASQPELDPLTQPIQFKDLDVEVGFKQTTPLGGTWQISQSFQRVDRMQSPVPASIVNPLFTAITQLQITQPLLQNFGTAINQARILIAKDTQKVSMLDFRLAMEKDASDLEEAYWNLVQSQKEVKVQEELVTQAKNTTDRLYHRRGQGVSDVEISQAAAQLASRQAQLVRARANMNKYSDQIKLLVSDPDMPVSGAVQILATDEPVDQPVKLDLAEQIQTGITNRAELQQQQIRVDSNTITLDAARNNLLPKLDLQAGVNLEGDAASVWPAFSKDFRAQAVNWNVGFQFQVPLGNREARAIYQRTLLQRQQSIDQYRQLIEKVTADVKDAHREVMTSWEEVVQSRSARLMAREALRLLEEREPTMQIDPSFINTKLQLQSNLADQERQEIEATVRYNIAIKSLERAKGTILRYDNIILEENPIPYGVGPRDGKKPKNERLYP